MPGERYRHIFLGENFRQTHGYTNPRVVFGDPKIRPDRDRVGHSEYLRQQIENAWTKAEHSQQRAAVHTERRGAYIVFEGEPGFELSYQSLESIKSGIRLHNVQIEDVDGATRTLATIYIPNDKRHLFLNKLQKYQTDDTETRKPKYADLIDSISDIRFAILESFWRYEEKALIPQESRTWVEAWLASDENDVLQRFVTLVGELKIEEARGVLVFPERTVKLIRANRTQLEQLLERSDDIAEFRVAKSVASYFVELENKDQLQHAQDLLSRTTYSNSNNVAICILDSGVNNGHILIRPVLTDDDRHAVDPSWGTHDHDRKGHGTCMAGIASYGDLINVIGNNETLLIDHQLESSKVLPLHGQNPFELWGFITTQGVSRAEIQAPDRKRIICMGITASETLDGGRPSSWSAEIDKMASGSEDEIHRLFILSAGNVFDGDDWLNYCDSNKLREIQDPGQSWNALTVGAFTEKMQIPPGDPMMNGYYPIAPNGGLSPFSTTSIGWTRRPQWSRKTWPIKPEIVFEGGNVARGPNQSTLDHDALQLLSTHRDPQVAQFAPFGMTSAACALAARTAAQIQAQYPDAWPETIRALIVHSAEWTAEMRNQFLNGPVPSKADYGQLMRICGYGVPNLTRALNCASNSLTLISEAELQPFDKRERDGAFVTKEMHLYDLPWPTEILRGLGEIMIEMRVTLSYFIEPGPGEVGWKNRYRYASHALRFDVNGPEESRKLFLKRVSKQARTEGEGAPGSTGPSDRWKVGIERNSGSVHSDIWEGQAAQLAASNLIAVFPIGGWWRERHHLQKWNKRCRYSLIVSIHTPENTEDIYIPVAQQIGIPVEIQIG